MNILTGPRMYMGHMYMYIVGPKEDQSAPFRKSGVTIPQVPKKRRSHSHQVPCIRPFPVTITKYPKAGSLRKKIGLEVSGHGTSAGSPLARCSLTVESVWLKPTQRETDHTS